MNGRRIDFIDVLGRGGALLFLVCLYTSPAHLYPVLETLRPAMLAATAMLAAVVARRLMRGERIRLAGGPGAAMLVLFTLLSMSTLWALHPTSALGFALGALKLPLAFVGLVGCLRVPRHVRLAMSVAAIASLVPAWGTLERYNAGIDLVEGYRGAWIGLLANPNELAMVMAVTVPWALHSAQHSYGWKRLLYLTAFGLQVSTIVVTHSRGGALGMAVGLVATALLAENKLRAFGLVGAAAAALVMFAPESFWRRTETISTYETDASAMGRLRAWETGFNALEDRPLLGVGAGGYVDAWNRYMSRNIRERAYASHNMWMQVAVELGYVGAAVFASMLALLVGALWKARSHTQVGAEARTLLASLAALIVCGTTGGYAFNWFFYMVLGVAGATVACARAAPEPAPRARESAVGAPLPVA